MKKTKLLYFALFSFMLISCRQASYLTGPENLHKSRFGAYIKVKTEDKEKFKGELIAVENEKLLILGDSGAIKRAMYIPFEEVQWYNLNYARRKPYYLSIPAFVPFSISHGFFGLLSLPINLLTTSVIAIEEAASYSISGSRPDPEKLRKFARLPQGLPPEIKPDDIR